MILAPLFIVALICFTFSVAVYAVRERMQVRVAPDQHAPSEVAQR